MELFLVRHAECLTELPGWDRGYIDVGLTARGVEQAEHLAAWLADAVAPDAAYTSTLARARDTAGPLARRTGLALRADDRLREVGNARPDGSAIPADAMPLRFGGVRGSIEPDRAVCDGAETWRQFVARVGGFLDDVTRAARQRVVVVTHSGVIEAITDLCFGVRPPRRVELAMHHTGITHWQLRDDPEPWLLRAHDLVAHLLRADAPARLLSGVPGDRPALAGAIA